MPGYTPPAGNAVNFNFTGAYTPPAGDNVAINFTIPRVLTMDPGAYVLTGSAAALPAGRRLQAWDNLIINGEFPIDTSDWTVSGADTTFTSDSGVGVLTLGPAAAGGYAWQAVSVVPGETYTLSAFLRPKNAYILSANAGSYVLTGTPVDVFLGSGGVSSAFDGQDVTVSGLAACAWIISSDGFTYKDTFGFGFLTKSVAWIIPQLHMSDYECRATDTHVVGAGETTAPGTFGSWLDLASDHEWGWVGFSGLHVKSRFLVEIRRKSDLVVVGSGTVYLDGFLA